MMNILKNSAIGTRISLALALPVVGLLFFSGYTTVDKYRTAGEMNELLELAGLGPVDS